MQVTLIHVPTKEEMTFAAPLVLGKPGPQEVGSAITYMRRYTLLSILGLVGEEDDDAERAQPAPKATRITKKQRSEEEGPEAPSDRPRKL